MSRASWGVAFLDIETSERTCRREARLLSEAFKTGNLRWEDQHPRGTSFERGAIDFKRTPSRSKDRRLLPIQNYFCCGAQQWELWRPTVDYECGIRGGCYAPGYAKSMKRLLYATIDRETVHPTSKCRCVVPAR